MSSLHRSWKISILLRDHRRTPLGCKKTSWRTSSGLFFFFSSIIWRLSKSLLWRWLLWRTSQEMLFRTWGVGASSLHPDSMRSSFIFANFLRYMARGNCLCRSWPIVLLSSAHIGRLFNSVLLWTQPPPSNSTFAFRSSALFTVTVKVIGQSLNWQQPLHMNSGHLFEPTTLSLCLRKATEQKGWMVLTPLAITFVHCSPANPLSFLLCFKIVHSFLSLKKNDWFAGSGILMNPSSPGVLLQVS